MCTVCYPHSLNITMWSSVVQPCLSLCYSDLVHTTESLRNAKLSAGKSEKENRNVDSLLEPYRTENARLVRENNELHLELLKLKDEKERVISGNNCVIISKHWLFSTV